MPVLRRSEPRRARRPRARHVGAEVHDAATADAEVTAEVDARQASAADAVKDAAAGDVATDDGIPFASADGSFPCVTASGHGPTTCDRGTQWCYHFGGVDSYVCRSFDHTCMYVDAPADAGCTPAFYWDAAACDGGYRRCACVTATCLGGGTCSDDDAGGITVNCISGTCYGAPPARPERLVS